jgi:hypothetical protein
MRNHSVFFFVFTMFLFLNLQEAETHAGTPVFPYTTRIHDYNGWNSAVRGDTNTVGMAGANVAMPNSISSSEANPAGYAMELSALSAQINNNTIRDNNIQKDGGRYDSSQWGLAVSPPGWGLGIAYYSPSSEIGRYISQSGIEGPAEVSVKELRFTVAHTFLNTKLSVGIAAKFMKAVREIDGFSDDKTAWGIQIGALYRLVDHVVLGGSFSPQTTIDPSIPPSGQSAINGFDRAIISPARLALGIGWMPNRFFKAGVSVFVIAPTKNTALLYDQTLAYGQKTSIQPRVGASYVLAEYTNFKMEWAAGMYYESSRIDTEPSRLHYTTGLEANPYFINTGAGFDLAPGYQNVMLSVGIDLVRLARTYNIIPKDPVPAYDGFFPSFHQISADGMPDAMTTGETKSVAPIKLDDVGTIVKEIPEKIEDKFDGKTPPADAELKKPVVHHHHHHYRHHKKVPANPPGTAQTPPAPATSPMINPGSPKNPTGSNDGQINLGN